MGIVAVGYNFSKTTPLRVVIDSRSISLEELAVTMDEIRFFRGMLVHFGFCH